MMNCKQFLDLFVKTLVFNIITAVSIIFIVLATNVLPVLGRKHVELPNDLSILKEVQFFTIGNHGSWFLVATFFVWAYLWLAFTKTKHFGPTTESRLIPVYKVFIKCFH